MAACKVVFASVTRQKQQLAKLCPELDTGYTLYCTRQHSDSVKGQT